MALKKLSVKKVKQLKGGKVPYCTTFNVIGNATGNSCELVEGG